MRTRPAALLGVIAAFVSPWHLSAPRLRRLMTGSPGAGVQGDSRRAICWANRALRVLARLPRSPWRSTCLYRGVAECLAMRWLGSAAALRLGARRDPDSGKVLAHAWAEGAAAVPPPDALYQVFSAGNRAAG